MRKGLLNNHSDSAISVKAFRQQSIRKIILILSLALFTLFMMGIAINAGSSNTNLRQVVKTLLGQQTQGTTSVVIWQIRLPRVLSAVVAGIGLSIVGDVMQTSLRNPLASPSTLSISSASAFGANLAIVFFNAGTLQSNTHDAVFISNPYTITICSFLFAMFAMLAILMLARLRRFTPESVILSGVALGSLFSAGTTLIQYFADDVQVASMVFWTFGDLGRVSWKEVGILSAVTLVALIYFLIHRWDYNVIESGEETAIGLGVNVTQIRIRSLLVASLVTAVSVSFLGIIGFIGLIAPHFNETSDRR